MRSAYLALLSAALAAPGLLACPAISSRGADASSLSPAGDGGAPGCRGEADCDGGVCVASTGQCAPRSCLTDGCDAGSYCSPATLACTADAPGEHPTYRAQTLAGHDVQQRLGARDAVGRAAFGEFHLLVASRDGRYLYFIGESVLRLDQSTMRLETLSGMGWPGHVDGPADLAQFEVDFYQQGGLGLSPDDKTLYFTAVHGIRVVDLETGEASTLSKPELSGLSIRSLAVGASGTLYLSTWTTDFALVKPDGAVEKRTLVLDEGGKWGGGGGPPGYLVVDEARGVAYGLERNWKSGAFYRWPLAGGKVEWLNHAATGEREPVQYLSDGPVSGLEMANPAGMTIDAQGYVYLGAGDGRTFRRFNPDSGTVESLCRLAGEPATSDRFEWCLGDGVRNKPFGSWMHRLAFDGQGNGYFGYTVWPRLLRLAREVTP